MKVDWPEGLPEAIGLSAMPYQIEIPVAPNQLNDAGVAGWTELQHIEARSQLGYNARCASMASILA